MNTPDPEEDPGVVLSDLAFPVVGIGASAGGLAALQGFFEAMPADCGMAFVVVMHLSPRHESNAAAILQKATRMPVDQVTDSMAIECNQVYVIPPRAQLQMTDGQLRLLPIKEPRGQHSAIDTFFRTLAQVHQTRAVAIILSGSGADGAVGLTRIKECGGLAFAQAPDDADFDSMPKAAIATGAVDIVLPVAEMPQKLLTLWHNARIIELPTADDGETAAAEAVSPDPRLAAEKALSEIMLTLRSRTGHDFRHYKRATVLRRIERRLQVNALANLPAYQVFLSENPAETSALLRDMLIGVTNFFRDREAFEALEREVIGPLFDGREADDPVRVWVAGCATGEEAYSLGILLSEQGLRMARPPELQVFATDIDETAIVKARTGAYPEAIVTDVTPSRLREFFNKEDSQYRVRKSLREQVLFARHNLLRDPPFSRLDLVCCRNLLIYLDREVQAEILEIFHFALRPGGWLFLGSSESADSVPKLFTVVDKKNRLYRANAGARSGRNLPSLPLGSTDRVTPGRVAAVSSDRPPAFAEIHQRALEHYAPPSVLIDRQHGVVHLSDSAGRFLRYVGGSPSHDLLRLVAPALRLELRTALFQAAQTGSSVETRRVKLQRDGKTYCVNLIVRPLQTSASGDYTLVLFDEVESSTGDEPAGQAREDRLVLQLEEELQRSKEQLQGIIEQSETTAEELKASNEELQAINEELRSATEELETSREELQSVNEELITVNYELKTKVDETSKVNDDLQNLIASTDIATVFVDSAMRIQRYTPRALDLFNIIATDQGRPLSDITHRLDYPMMADDAAQVFASLQPVEREVRANGRWYIARILPYRTDNNRIDGAVLTFVDIARVKQVEEQLRAHQEQMRLVVESTHDYAIFTTDEEGLITSWNRGAERMFGYAESEALGQPAAMTFIAEDRAVGIPAQELATAREQGRSEDERWHQRKDGSRFYCSGITTALDKDQPRGFAKIGRDLTAAKQAEAERDALLAREQEAREQAQHAIALKDEFLAVMSHELKHPLNLIQVNSELLKRLPDTQKLPPVVRLAETISRAVGSQAKIIDDMLDLSRVHTGKLTLNRVPVDWQAMVRTIVDALRDEAATRKLRLRLLPVEQAVAVWADPIRVEQMVWNLVSNAIKFTPEGGSVDLRLFTDDKFATLEVRDTGIGIAPGFIEHVFEMFRQADAGTTRKQGGLGIGLALVRQLANLHGGGVRAASEGHDKGACFTLWLPLPAGKPDPQASAMSAESLLEGRRVLLVDDTLDALESFGHLLSIFGMQVTTASSGLQALELITSQDFDLILSDIGMPGMDGYALISQVRQGSRNAATVAVAITGYGRRNDVERALAAGFNAHVSKPVSIDALTDVLAGLIPST